MAFLAYIDCSGDARDPQSRVIAVGGYVAHEDQWADFELKWTAILRAFGVDALHMKEYAHSVKGSAFESWRGDEVKRRAFMESLTGVINECGLHSISSTLLLSAYDAADNEYLLRDAIGPPYAVATLRTVAQVYRWHSRRQHAEPLLIRLEHGDNDQGSFRAALERLAKGRANDIGQWPLPVKKKHTVPSGETVHVVPFQAADFICYEHAKMFTDMLVKGKKTVRESLFRVSYPWKGDDDAHQWMNIDSVRSLARALGVTPRYNRDSNDIKVRDLPNDPLAYSGIDQPLVSFSSRASRSVSASRCVVQSVRLIR